MVAVAKKDIDVGIVWGPLAGYFVKKSSVPAHAAAAGREGLTDRLPLPVQHRHGRAPARTRSCATACRRCSTVRPPRSRPSLKEYGVPRSPLSLRPRWRRGEGSGRIHAGSCSGLGAGFLRSASLFLPTSGHPNSRKGLPPSMRTPMRSVIGGMVGCGLSSLGCHHPSQAQDLRDQYHQAPAGYRLAGGL